VELLLVAGGVVVKVDPVLRIFDLPGLVLRIDRVALHTANIPQRIDLGQVRATICELMSLTACGAAIPICRDPRK